MTDSVARVDLAEGSRTLRSRSTLGLIALAAVIFAITAVPYVLAYARAAPGTTFGGTLIWSDDQDCYGSFIRQAFDGHVLFVNRLTYREHAPVYFNLEWLLVGFVMRLFGGSAVAAYHVWRAAGALAVCFGFFALARIALENPRLRWVALVMCLFGGTLQALFVGLNWIGASAGELVGWSPGSLPTSFPYFAAHPFAQILANPHFSLPLGVFMLAVAAYLRGEATGRARWYAIAGLLAAAEGSMRPYEMIVLYTFVPAFAAIEIAIARRIDWRKLGVRLLPLAVVAPVFAFTIYIFELDPVFKYWSRQGVDVPLAPLETLGHVGLAAVLLGVRLCFVKRFPLSSPIERALLAWMLCVFFFVHAGAIPLFAFMPYTPQLVTSLVPAAILLGVVVLDPERWPWAQRHRRGWWAIVIAWVCLDALDSWRIVDTLTPPEDTRASKLYIPSAEVEAFAWLDRESREDDVVLCSSTTGHRLAARASVRVVAGHWSVTPEFDDVDEGIQRFYRGTFTPERAAIFLRRCRVSWIYVGANERTYGDPRADLMPGFTRRVVNADVTIYARNR